MTRDEAIAEVVVRATVHLHALLATGPLTRLAALQPRDTDYERLFVPAAAAGARAGYAGLWGAPPPWPAGPDQTVIHVAGAWSDALGVASAVTRAFPGGYATIATALQPGVVWMVWEVVAPGQRDGISFDGLTAIDDRFVWCPKPWRVVPTTD